MGEEQLTRFAPSLSMLLLRQLERLAHDLPAGCIQVGIYQFKELQTIWLNE